VLMDKYDCTSLAEEDLEERSRKAVFYTSCGAYASCKNHAVGGVLASMYVTHALSR